MSVAGIVVDDASGAPLAGLRVRAFDKDMIFDDVLGDAATDAAGRFEIRFSESQFRDFNETAPDVYIRVYDASEKVLLYTSEKAVRMNAGVREWFDVRIAARR